jgi:hypothetical protein
MCPAAWLTRRGPAEASLNFRNDLDCAMAIRDTSSERERIEILLLTKKCPRLHKRRHLHEGSCVAHQTIGELTIRESAYPG